MNLLNGIEKLNATGASAQARWLGERRNSAQKKLPGLPWPTRKQENWKYTNLNFLAQTDWQPNTTSAGQEELPLAEKEYVVFKAPQFETLSFINGRCLDGKSENFSVRRLNTLAESEVRAFLNLENGEDLFENLNWSWLNEGLFIEIPEARSLSKPICVDFYYSSENQALAAHPLVLIKVGARSSAKIMFRTFGKGTYFSNVMSRVILEKESSLEFANYQSNSLKSVSFSNVSFYLSESSNLRNFDVSLHGQLNRQKLDVYHQGMNSSSQAYGLYLTKGQGQSDHYTNIEHRVGHCQSQQLYKGMLADESRAVFNGRVFIAHGAEKASSEQLNNNLLLSSKAEIDSKPQLEILADDVKATHGSTVGQIDAEEIFYLQSRGISADDSMKILAQGFAYEVMSFIQNPEMNSFLKQELSEYLQGLDFQ